ncbi:hypothetical protein Daus18300_003537 [Diaporthe australafricana]|uniref:Uncharacterized protein n=1 Tax=Diaporthe australafricana TaxID=127596 RepID=A0ABR3XEZ2_9PEZI
MRLFSRDDAAKARRKQELDEQQKKKKIEPTPYVHMPTHALSDSLLSVPHAYKTTDKQRLKEAHKHRLEKETSALASGVDKNATDVPAKYWQGQPLPGFFKAPSATSLAESAITDAWKGKKFEMPTVLKAKQDSRTPTDEGYASGLSRNSTGAYLLEQQIGPSDSSSAVKTNRDRHAQAAHEGEGDEVERLRRKLRELERKQQGSQKEQDLTGPPSPTKPNGPFGVPSNPLVTSGPNLVPGKNVGVASGIENRSSTADDLKGLDSEQPNRRKSEAAPSTSVSVRDVDVWDAVDCYDWAIHCDRLRATEKTAKMPEASDLHGAPRPKPEYEACYASLDEFFSDSASAPTARSQDIKMPKASESESSHATKSVKRSRQRRNSRPPSITPSESSVADFDFGFRLATKSGRQSTAPTPGNCPSEPQRQESKAVAKKDHASDTLISF